MASIARLLAGAQGDDVRVVGRALGAAVPRPVVVGAVAVVLAVGLVVLVVVGDQVAQGEAVVHGDQVDRRGRSPAAGCAYRSDEPVNRVANSPSTTGRGCARSPASMSRYWPFHSRHSGGNRPRS